MARKPALVTETELAILEILWNNDSDTVREIVDAVYGQHTPALHATVKSLLERLAAKGFVSCDNSGFMHRFAARVSRDEYVAQELERLAESHYGGALTPLLMSLVNKVKVSRKDRDAIRKIIKNIPEKS
ncbi:MAG: mecI 4 [Planctomycetaceae bacterium]|nr:mecI 4 [Planctomycetaceae bacterium]